MLANGPLTDELHTYVGVPPFPTLAVKVTFVPAQIEPVGFCVKVTVAGATATIVILTVLDTTPVHAPFLSVLLYHVSTLNAPG